MSADTVLRMAVAAWLLDTEPTMPLPQWHALATRLQDHTPFTAGERARLQTPLLTWAHTMGAAYAAVVAREFAAAPIPVAPRASGLATLAQFPGQAGRDQAAALNEEAPHG